MHNLIHELFIVVRKFFSSLMLHTKCGFFHMLFNTNCYEKICSNLLFLLKMVKVKIQRSQQKQSTIFISVKGWLLCIKSLKLINITTHKRDDNSLIPIIFILYLYLNGYTRYSLISPFLKNVGQVHCLRGKSVN